MSRCRCEFQNGGAGRNGIVCDTNDGTIQKIGKCNSTEWCTGNATDDYPAPASQFCEKGNHELIVILIFKKLMFYLL